MVVYTLDSICYCKGIFWWIFGLQHLFVLKNSEGAIIVNFVLWQKLQAQ